MKVSTPVQCCTSVKPKSTFFLKNMGCCVSSSQLLPPPLPSYPTPDFLPWFVVKPELFIQQSTGWVKDEYVLGKQIGAGRR